MRGECNRDVDQPEARRRLVATGLLIFTEKQREKNSHSLFPIPRSPKTQAAEMSNERREWLVSFAPLKYCLFITSMYGVCKMPVGKVLLCFRYQHAERQRTSLHCLRALWTVPYLTLKLMHGNWGEVPRRISIVHA